ncbi:MAG: hypothetical protein N2044_08050 [Cyclobacteriaceae bacterium]|nr:hypothetical protein [Cyclobacteriaceae bacterium]
MKNTFIISYDLVDGADYTGLWNALKEYGTWARITESTWAIVTTQKATEVRDNLLQFIPEGGRIFVVKSGSVAAWRNVICSNDWLKKNL